MPRSWSELRWTLWSPGYDLVARRLAPGRRRAISLLDLQGHERILLVGCGTGLDLELIPPASPLTAIDLDPAMLAATRRRAARLARNIDARLMDAAALDLPDASFDLVLLHLVLAVVPDPRAVARESARVLRPGGRVSIFDKFLGEGRRPSPLRRAVNVASRLIATDINRRLSEVIEGSGLELEHVEPSLLGGFFQIAIARKPR
ncbi:MAG TPA: methyltransferase domain-containing protein [Thermoanaerobaculia bacterium]|nr:methyltransferase domain-containing protein [Thermoanaerobaculia bacterium]